MKVNYERFQFQMTFAELGYSKDYLRFLFDRLGLLGNMEEDFKDYKEQGFLHIEDYAVYKLSQMSVNDLINHMLDVIDVFEYEIEKLVNTQKQIIWNGVILDNYGGGGTVRISKEMFEEAKKIDWSKNE